MKPPAILLFADILFHMFGCQTKVPMQRDVLSLHPENPNYFMFKRQPTILITSGEHYGAVMNTAFNYEKYLKTLTQEGFNYTRVFIGPYSETGGNNFGISNNTMNPKPENWLTPWLKDRSTQKYDLLKWNKAFFDRLTAFILAASKNGIVVEVTLFTSYYTNHQWSNSPFNPKNNIQKFDSISFKQVNTVNNGQLMDIQDKYVRKVIRKLNTFGNVFFEIQNEPWSDNLQFSEKITDTDTLTHPARWQQIVETANPASLEWQKQIAQIITDEETQLPNKHLIAQNISNYRNKIEKPDPNISIFNFHYAYPEAASQNLGLKKVISLDETGFMPHLDYHYRTQAWKFILAGGALYNNLDYSFTVGNENGNFAIDAVTPGWGGVNYRNQLQILKKFMDKFDFIRMEPDNSILKLTKGSLTGYQVLAEAGKQYAIYLEKGNLLELALQIPDGKYTVEWINILTGNIVRSESISATNRSAAIVCPDFQEDIALKIKREVN